VAIAAQLSNRRRDPLLLVTIVVALATLGVGLTALFGGSSGVTSPPSTHRPVGPAQITVPNVLGMTAGSAKGDLRAAGLGAQVRSEQSSLNQAGTIMVQSPKAGSSVARHGVVILTASNGRAGATNSP
jgi:hypothetical protein